MKEKHKAAPKTECILPAGKSDGGDDAPIYNNGVNLFDQYTIFSKIGSGGMGVVYLAKDKRLDRFVSIKRLNHQAQTNPSLRKRFLQEARAVASLNHVHIVHIYALGEDSDGPYIVMEYVAGPANKAYAQNGGEADNPSVPNPPLTLEKYTSERGSLSADEAIGLMIKISSAIAYAHNCGVIHRDLKPSNILLDESNEPKIVDFGLARLIHGSTDFSKLTVPGEKLISLGYGAPEQEKDASFSDERSDVYGLGALLYFMLTGQNPRYFREQDVPVSLRELVVKSLAMDKEQRLPSATAFIDSLKEIQNRTRVETPTVKTTWRCKWCDAVNPVSTKFCAECGWDGRELCPECGAETFIGIQYCNSCGADIRSYENILNTIKKIKDDFSCHRYELVISGAGQVHGFEPAGQSGRRYLQEVQTLKESSEKSIALRKQVKEQISIELNAENYERARRFILQYRDLTGEPEAFAAEERELPEKTLKRDLGRVRRFILRRDWTTAAHLCDTLLESVAPNNENVLRLARLIRTRRTLRKCMCLFVLTLLPLSLYILSYPLSLRWTDQPMPKALAYFYAPARYLYSAGDSQIGALLNKYAKLTFPDYGKIRLSQDLQTESILQTVPLPENVQSQKDKFEKQLGELKTAQDAFELKWSDEYIRELNTLADKYRRDGDFNAWKLTTEELKAFSGEQRFATTQNHTDIAPELLLLKQKYRKMKDRHTLALCRKVTTVYNEYINSLTDIQKGFMQNKNMSLAAAINDEICSARESAHFKQAKQMIDAAEQNRSGEPAAADSRIFEQSFADVKIHEVEDALLKLRNELEKANAIATENSEQCNRNYVLKLQQVKADYQQEGHYDGVLATEAENSRFRAERHLDESVVVDKDYQALHLLQTTTIEQLKTIKLVRAKKIISATENCAQSLGQLQKKFTVGGDMKSAAAIDSEIKSIRTAVDYLAAKQVLAPRPATKEQRSNNESE